MRLRVEDFEGGVKVTFEDETTGQKDVFQHEEGLVEVVLAVGRHGQDRDGVGAFVSRH